MYKLPTSMDELKSWTSRTQRAGTQQHASIADVTGVNFAKGDIRIPFLVAGNRWWVPGKSYVRLRVRVSRGDLTPLLINSNIAPAMGFASTLFQSAEFQIRGVPVSRLTDFVPQIDQYIKRTSFSNSWMHTAGESMDYQQSGWDQRRSNWSIPPQQHGLVNTQYYLASDLASNPQTSDVIGNWTVAIAAGPPSVLTLSAAVAGGSSFADNTFFQGDRVFFNGGAVGAANSRSFSIIARTGVNTYSITPTTALAATALATYGDIQVSRDIAVETQQIDATTFELIWQPPLSIFGLSHALPSMSCELILKGRPGDNYALACINTEPSTAVQPAAAAVNAKAFTGVPGNAADFTVQVIDLFFYSYQVESDRLDDGTFMLDLEEPNCAAQNLEKNSGLQQKQFIVSPSTYQLGVAFQDAAAGRSTDKPITFFGYHQTTGAAGPGPGIQYYDHTDLGRYFLQYSNMTFPQPDADPQYAFYPISSSTPGQFLNYNTQRWMESQLATGQLWMPGGCEPIQEWWDKGPLHVFPTLKDPVDRSTNVVVNAYFAKAPQSVQCLLFSMCRKVALIRVANGSVQEVDVQDQ